MKDSGKNDNYLNFNNIIEEENSPVPTLSRKGTIDIKTLTNNEINQKIPYSILQQ